MSAYLLTCQCGKTVPVEIGQAGGQVTCACGKQVDVPTLRQLRQLPQAKTEAAPQKAPSWSARKGFIAASLIFAAGLLGCVGWSWWHDPEIAKFDPKLREQQVEEMLKTPKSAYEVWTLVYKPMAERGIPTYMARGAEQINQFVANRRFFRGMLSSVAGLLVLAALVVAFWPKPQPIARRPNM